MIGRKIFTFIYICSIVKETYFESHFRIVDPDMALQMLHKTPNKPLSLGPRGEPIPRNVSMGGPGPMPVPAPNNAGQSNLMGGMIPGGFSSAPPAIRQEGSMSQGFGGPGEMPFDRDMDPRSLAALGPPPNRDPRAMPIDDSQRFGGRDPRSRDPRAGGGDPRVDRNNFDPRSSNNGQSATRGPMQMSGSNVGPHNLGPSGSSAVQLPPHLATADPGRTALIMQVLQLTDDQIAMLPAEQRISIMELKKQIAQTPK